MVHIMDLEETEEEFKEIMDIGIQIIVLQQWELEEHSPKDQILVREQARQPDQEVVEAYMEEPHQIPIEELEEALDML